MEHLIIICIALTVSVLILAAFIAGYLLREVTAKDLLTENAQLREFLYRSRGYKIAERQEHTDEPILPKPNASMPQMWEKAQTKAPDLFRAKNDAMLKDIRENA